LKTKHKEHKAHQGHEAIRFVPFVFSLRASCLKLRNTWTTAFACILTLAACVSHPEPTLARACSSPEANVTIASDGAVAWNGTPLVGDEGLDRCMKIAAATRPQPKIHLRPSKEADWKRVARLLATAQRVGLSDLGFTGNERQN